MSEPTAQPQALLDVGSALRQARLRRGLSLEAAHQQTRISKKFLEALEANRFEDFPARVYLRGFLKGYCDLLELDFDPLWQKLQPPAAPEPQPPASAGPDKAPREAPPASRRPPAPAGERSTDGPARNAAPLLAAALLAAAAASWLLLRPRRQEAPPAPRPPAAALAPIRATPRKMTLRIVLRGEAWLRLRCDGRLRFEGRAPAGFVQEWTASDSFLLRASEPADLALSLDGKELRLDPASKSPSGDYSITRP